MSDSILPEGKTCTKCDLYKLLSEFRPNKIGRFGVNPSCKVCNAKASREYAANNKEKVAAKKVEYRASPAGKQAAAEYNKRYAAQHAERLRAKRIAQYHATKDERRELKAVANKAYREANKSDINARRRVRLATDDALRERTKQRSARWYAANADAVAENARAHYAAHREAVKARVAKYQRDNPEATRFLHRIKAHRRRELLRDAGGSFTKGDIEALLKLQRGKCANCAASILEMYHIDHRQPVAKGGSNHRWNLELLCPKCNLRKSDKLPHEFAAENGRLI